MVRVSGATPESEIAATARERVSATTLSDPLMCQILVVNSATNDKCRVCRGNRSVSLERV